MRNISNTLTILQMRARSKAVTRRLGWDFLRTGDLLMSCEKCQGLGPGGKLVRITPIVVVGNRHEPLNRMIKETAYGAQEAALEGFPELSGAEFAKMFCGHMGCDPGQMVNRIEYRFIPGGFDYARLMNEEAGIVDCRGQR